MSYEMRGLVTFSTDQFEKLKKRMAEYLRDAVKEPEMEQIEKLRRMITYEWAYLSAEIKPEKGSPVEKAFFRILGEIEEMIQDAIPKR